MTIKIYTREYLSDIGCWSVQAYIHLASGHRMCSYLVSADADAGDDVIEAKILDLYKPVDGYLND